MKANAIGPPSVIQQFFFYLGLWVNDPDRCYSVPDSGAEYCDEHVCVCVCACVRACVRACVCVCVCVFVCPRSYLRNYTCNLHRIFVSVTYGRGSSLFWQRSDTLCTSGFMDDVIFAHKPRLLDVAAQLKRSAHAALGLAINCPR